MSERPRTTRSARLALSIGAALCALPLGCGSAPGSSSDTDSDAQIDIDVADVGDARDGADDAVGDAEGSDSRDCGTSTNCEGQCVDLLSNVDNCSACGAACLAGGAHSVAVCEDGVCLTRCEDRWFDDDHDDACERFCVATGGGVESCDGEDNDCDGFADELDPEWVARPCDVQQGVCAGAVESCTDGEPACDYATQATAARYQVHETRCDGRDNDCDGTADEICCMPATEPAIDDRGVPLTPSDVQVFVAGLAVDDAGMPQILMRIAYMDDGVEKTAWRAESSAPFVAYHPAAVDSQLLDEPVHGDGVFYNGRWYVWYGAPDGIRLATLEPDGDPVDGALDERLGAVTADVRALRAWRLGDAHALVAFTFVGERRIARYVVVPLDGGEATWWADLESAGDVIVGAWGDPDEFYLAITRGTGTAQRVAIVSARGDVGFEVAAIPGVPAVYSLAGTTNGGIAGAFFHEGVLTAAVIDRSGELTLLEGIDAGEVSCAAGWAGDDDSPALAVAETAVDGTRLVLHDGRGRNSATWVADALCPVDATTDDNLVFVAVGLMDGVAPRRIAVVTTTPDGSYFCDYD